MQKWEYTTLNANVGELFHDGIKVGTGGGWQWTDWLNRMGDQGWELASSYAVGSLTVVIFKRPKA